jgi:hypothetical protein
VYKNFSLAGDLGVINAGPLKSYHLGLGARGDWASPYGIGFHGRASAFWTGLTWDGLPGDFDPAVGWEVGIGAGGQWDRMTLGLEIGYRGAEYDYNPPDFPTVRTTRDTIDMSGFTLYGSAGYRF